MGDSSREAIAIVEESVWGTTPSSALATAAYITGVTGGLERATIRTNALRSNRKRPVTVLTNDQGNLTLAFELAYGDVVPSVIAEGVLGNDWSAAASVTATDISFAAVDNSMSSVAETLTVFPVGRWVRVAGSVANDGFHFVIASTTSKLTFGTQSTIVDGAATPSITVDNDGALREGTATKSFTVERNFTGQSSTPFRAQKGLGASSLSLDVSDGSIVTGSAAFMGLAPAADAAATAGSGAYTAAVTTEPMSGNNAFDDLILGAAAYAGQVQSVSLALNSAVRTKTALGLTEPFAIGYNAFDFSGSLSVYKDDTSDSIYSAVRSFTPHFMSFTLTDPAGNVLIFTAPYIKYTGGVADNPGNDGEIYQSLPIALDEHPTYGYMFQIDRFAA